MSTRHAAGCIVYRHTPEGLRFLLISDAYGHWTFPKGHLEHGESSATAACREVAEETGVVGHRGAHIDTIVYSVTKKGQTFTKQVDWYLLETTSDRVVLQTEEGISAFQWETTDEVAALLGYPQLRDTFAKARAELGV